MHYFLEKCWWIPRRHYRCERLKAMQVHVSRIHRALHLSTWTKAIRKRWKLQREGYPATLLFHVEIVILWLSLNSNLSMKLLIPSAVGNSSLFCILSSWKERNLFFEPKAIWKFRFFPFFKMVFVLVISRARVVSLKKGSQQVLWIAAGEPIWYFRGGAKAQPYYHSGSRQQCLR